MKYILKLTLGLLIGVGFLASCDDDSKDVPVGFSIDKEDIAIGKDGGTEQLVVSTDKKWYASTDKSWIKITPANGIGTSECTISVDSTVTTQNREAVIRFVTEGGEQKKVSISQLGYDRGIFLQQTDTLIESSGKKKERVLLVKVTTNVLFDVTMENPEDPSEEITWLTYERKKFDLDYGDRPRTTQLRFTWNNNANEFTRAANVLITPKAEYQGAPSATLVVNQKAAPVITDDRAGDSLALLAVAQLMNFSFETWDASENMKYWSGVTLWEKTDEEVKKNKDLLGRVREAHFFYFDTDDGIPYQVSKLKYAETLNFFSNSNKSFRNVDLDPSVLLGLQYLKHLEISSYGIKSINENFAQLGNRLVSLDLGGNNLTELPSWLNSDNFTKLKTLRLAAMRRWDTVTNLQNPGKEDFGMCIDANDQSGTFVKLLKWAALDTLQLSYCYIYGELPETIDGLDTYTDADFVDGKLPSVLKGTPKVLPNTRFLSINLNFLTGKVPTWLRYHPHLYEWDPMVLIFNQENGFDKNGKKVGFSDAPDSMDEYFKFYPDKKPENYK